MFKRGEVMELWMLWLILVFFLIVLEACTVNLVSIWFIISGIVSLFVSIFCDDFLIQFAIFVLLGLFLLLTTRKFLKRYIKPNKEKTNLDRILGEVAIVTEEILKNAVGEVKVDGKRWSAIAKEEIQVGEEVIVEKIDGVKLIVRKKEK
jgi:membrane protein implicated in regulation of membrane protease activity